MLQGRLTLVDWLHGYNYLNMSCHASCSTCTGIDFNNCLSCPSAATLLGGGCFCTADWDAVCTQNSSVKGFYISLQSFYTVLFPLVIFLYFLKTRLPYSYRIVTGLQGFSLLLFSTRIYYYFQNEFGLRLIAKSHGYLNLSSRLQTLSLNYAIPPIVIISCFTVVYLCGYHLVLTFRKTSLDYANYLQDNFIHLLNSLYFFGAKMMFFFIGSWINSASTQLSVIIPFIVFCLIIATVLAKLFYDFHLNKLQKDEVYEPELLLYSMLSSSSMVGLPLITNSLYYLVIYLTPLGLLVLIMLLNKNYQIWTKPKILFYTVEVLVVGFIVAFILLSDPYKAYSLLIAIVAGTIGIIAEMIYLYYSGVDLSKSNKVHPETNSQSLGEFEKERKVNKSSKTGPNAKRGSYF